MQWPKFLKFSLPKWNWKKISFFRPTFSFVLAWKRFVRQLPRESRSLLKVYSHFIIFGCDKSGKTNLVQSLIQQSQDLYPFDTVYKEHSNIQFYLGPQQVIQEISFSALENRTIQVRKQLIHLWKKLYAKKDPIVVIVYDCFKAGGANSLERNQFAQLLAGKISLLAGITQRPIPVQVVLTYADRFDGYLEFARCLKQQNMEFHFTLTSNFENGVLSTQLKSFYQQYSSLLLTVASGNDYVKVSSFIKEVSLFFPSVEKFLRDLINGSSNKQSVLLSRLSFSSDRESNGAFGVFQSKREPASAIFFRYPLLKHQLAIAGCSLFLISFLIVSYFQNKREVLYLEGGTSLLELFQLTPFHQELLPKLARITLKKRYLKPLFFDQKIKEGRSRLARQIWKHFIEVEVRKVLLGSNSEEKYLYFLGLTYANANNNMGRFILKNSDHWANVLNLEEVLVKLYLNCSVEESVDEYIARPSLTLPFMSLTPWVSFFKKFQEMTERPILEKALFCDLIGDVDKLLSVVNRMRNDRTLFAVATLLDEGGSSSDELIQAVRWVGSNLDGLDHFLSSLKQAQISPLKMRELTLSQLFVKIKSMMQHLAREEGIHSFALMNQMFRLDSNLWNRLVIVHCIEEALQEYVALNVESNIALFFESNEGRFLPKLSDHFGPFFKTTHVIPGCYSRENYEQKVRPVVEKLIALVDSLPINPQEKQRFTNFLVRQTVHYVKNYQEFYTDYFNSLDLETSSLEGLKKVLKDLTSPSSSFYDFLKMVQQQTVMFSAPMFSFRNREEGNDFAFLNVILTPQEGSAPIVEYQKVVEGLLTTLGVDPQALKYEEFDLLTPHLTVEAKLSLHISHNTPCSYLAKAKQCLSGMGVPEQFFSPFLRPFLQLEKLGFLEIKKCVERFWKMQFQARVSKILSQFPFNFSSQQYAKISEVEEIFNPKSEVHRCLKQILTACYSRKGNGWVPLRSGEEALDRVIYDQLCQVERISSLLWDLEGIRKPLTLQVRSVPFASIGEESVVPTLSYLIVDTQSVYNLNQSPAWQLFTVEWWKEGKCSVGVELFNKNTKGKSFRSLQSSSELWGFFDLLREGAEGEQNTWTWNVPLKERQQALPVSFCFKTSPQMILQGGLRYE